jgi:hypothetical protein
MILFERAENDFSISCGAALSRFETSLEEA